MRIISVYLKGPKRRTVLAPPPLNRAGMFWEGRGTDVMVRKLLANFEKRGGRVLRGHRAVDLVMDERRCRGVIAGHLGERIRFEARAVLLADGGFQANKGLLQTYISPAPDKVLQRNAGTGCGDGVQMALNAGAEVRGMDRFYGHVQSIDALINPALWPYPAVDNVITAGIAVKRNGLRFADEGLGGVFMANVLNVASNCPAFPQTPDPH